MANVTIRRTDGGSGAVASGAEFALQAQVEGGSASRYEWRRNAAPIPDATSAEYRATADDDTKGAYTVVVTVDGTAITSEPVEIELKAAAQPGDVQPPDAPAEPPPEYHRWFAITTFIVAVVLTGLVLWKPARSAWDLTKNDWTDPDKGAKALAASLGVPLTVLGGAAVALGAWMAVVEWRGRFKPKPVAEARGIPGIPAGAGEVIAAIGKLRGAALVMIVGAVLMLGAAWIGVSSADSEPAPTDTTTTDTTPTGPPPPPPPPPPPR